MIEHQYVLLQILLTPLQKHIDSYNHALASMMRTCVCTYTKAQAVLILLHKHCTIVSKFKSLYMCVFHEFYRLSRKLAVLIAIARNSLHGNQEAIPTRTSRKIFLNAFSDKQHMANILYNTMKAKSTLKE